MQERKFIPVEQLRSEYKKINKWAVIVGISEYKHKSWNLNYAHRDAEELHKLLLTEKGGNFKKENIKLLTNQQATKRNIELALHDFLHKPDKNDLVILYFACHGAPNPKRPNKNLYLLAHDTEPDRIAATGLRMREIDDVLKDILIADKVVIFADTCHSAGIGGNTGNRSVEDNSGLINEYLNSLSNAKPGVAILTSAEAREVSREGKQWGDRHGVFTHYVLEGMRSKADTNGDGIITVGELFEYVRENVKRETNHLQHPSIGTNQYDRNLPLAITGNIRSNSQNNQNTSNLEKNKELIFDLIADYSEIISSNPNNFNAYRRRGLNHYRLKQYEKAIHDYNKAIHLDPRHSDTYVLRGVSYKNLGKYQEAIDNYNEAISLDHRDSNAYCNRGFSYHCLKKYQEAIEDYTKAISLNPKGVVGYNNRGMSYHDINKYQEAIEDYNKAISLNPQYSNAYYNLANTYQSLHDHKQAVENYTKAISFNSHNAHAYNNRGTSYQALKEYEKAIADYTEAIRLNPNDTIALGNRVLSREALIH